MTTILDEITTHEEDLRLVTEVKKKKPAKIKKRCLHCGRKYKGVTALSVEPVSPDKRQPGICSMCRRSPEHDISEDDMHGQDVGVE